jgi:gluconokinase
MPNIPGLRSPYTKVSRLVYFGRMLDKIRLHAAGQLPPEYVANLGDSQPGVFDTRCCLFLGVKFADIQTRTLAGEKDEAILAWCHERGTARSDQDCEVWNGFMMKRGWRDAAHTRLQQRIAESGLQNKTIETFFDYIDCDEGRDPVAAQFWLK